MAKTKLQAMADDEEQQETVQLLVHFLYDC
jgi:hypothetical protein